MMLRIKKNRLTCVMLCLVLIYLSVAVFTGLGWIASPWDREVGTSYRPPSFESAALIMGTDIFGRSVFYKVLHGGKVAMSVGMVSAIISIMVGISLGALAGYFGGWIDDGVVWFYTTLSSVPHIMLLMAITFVLGKGLGSVYLALGATAWVGVARMIRAEFIRIRRLDYVIAAESMGASHFSRISKHILPNISHLIIVQFPIQFVSAIKSEVILSFLGLGVQGQPSWGVMIDDAKLELARGVWWQMGGATAAMVFIILAINMIGDVLRIELDPKAKLRCTK